MWFDDFSASYKESLFVSREISIRIKKDNLFVTFYVQGYYQGEKGEPYYKEGRIAIDDIQIMRLEAFKGIPAIYIEVCSQSFGRVNEEKWWFPGVDKEERFQRFEKAYKRERDELAERKEEKRQEDERRAKAPLIIKREYEEYAKMYPSYTIGDTREAVAFFYVSDERNLVIKTIGKKYGDYVEATFSLDKIHYYEKAGTIHYITKVDYGYMSQALAASFVPSKVNLAPAIIGGILAGPMGMAIGMAVGYEAGHFERNYRAIPQPSVDSQVNRIDDRSVILNYYSDEKKQYIDIELPADMYNFLQTHFAEKKYDIVLAAEKQKYVGNVQEKNAIAQDKQELLADNKDTLGEFELSAKKLKILRDNGLISEEEFNKKRDELLGMI